MPSKIRIVCPVASNGAVRVAGRLRELGYNAFKVRALPSRFTGVAVNWGGDVRGAINRPEAAATARNKLLTFRALDGHVAIPAYTENKQTAKNWAAEGPLLCRTTNGQGGSGITVARSSSQVVDAPLYVKYVKKGRELRLHMFEGKLIHVQEKKRKTGVQQSPDQKLIRSHDNGWVFCENNLDLGPTVLAVLQREGAKAMTAVGLDFGAIDVIIPKDNSNVIVLEINTRPGVESTRTTEAYATAIGTKANGG